MEAMIFDSLEYYKTYSREKGEIDLRSYLLPDVGLAEKIASGVYPTPTVLAELQVKHGQGPRDPNATGVEPFPPRRRKNEIFDAAKYTERDEYVKTLLPEFQESESDFAARLFRMCSSNLDKVRAAFYFVCTASVERMAKLESESEVYAMVRQMREMDNVILAFKRLLVLATVPFNLIIGFKKGADDEEGFEVRRGSNSWFACYVDGEWRFVDVFWGSQGVTGFDTGNFAKVNNGTVEASRKSDGEIVYKCNEQYFLPNPEIFILNHFPQKHLSAWQLLARPLSLSEFNQMPNFFSGSSEEMHRCGVTPQSHPLNVIVAAPGTVKIFLKETGEESYEYKTEIRIHNRSLNEDTRTAIRQQSDVKGYLSKMSRMNKSEVMLKFVPPCRGKFLLTIMVLRTVFYREESIKEITTAEYVSYVIHCPLAVTNAKTVPVGSEKLLGFGAGKALDEVEMTTNDPGEILAVDGEKQLVLESLNPELWHQLEYALFNSKNEALSLKHLLTWNRGTKTNIIFLSPDSGSYALVVNDGGEPICQFLLDAESEFRGHEFPLPDLKKLGGLGHVDERLSHSISTVSHPDPYIVCEEPSLELGFSATTPVEVKSELLYVDSSGQEVVMDSYKLINNAKQGFNIEVRFKMPGHYVLRIYVSYPHSDYWTHCFNYFIRSLGQLDGSAEQFPEAAPAWNGGSQLIQPKTVLLPINEFVPFTLRTNDSKTKVIYIENEFTKEKCMMSQDSDGLWQGGIQGNPQSAGALVRVMGGPEITVCVELLRYRFLTRDDRENRGAAINQAQELIRCREISERLRQRRRENYERGEHGMVLLPEDLLDGIREEESEKESNNGAAETKEARKDTSSECCPQGTLKQPDGPDEFVALAAWLNRALASDPECRAYLPFQLNGSEIGEKCRDGIVPCKVINHVSPGTIDERVLSKGPGVPQSQRHQNLTLMLNSAQSLGVPVSASAEDVESGSQSLIVDLLWQIIRLGHLAKVKHAAAVCGSEMGILPPEKLLLQWVNSQLEAAGCQRRIANFGEDIKDSEVYAYLLVHIAPKTCQRDMHQHHEIMQTADPIRRAQLVLHNAELLGAHPFFEPSSVANGNRDLNLTFVANLFINFCAKAPAVQVPAVQAPAVQAPAVQAPAVPVAKVRGQPVDRSTLREETTYLNWMNSLGVQPRVSDLYSDLQSGLIYLQLFDLIKPGVVRWQRVHKTFNKMKESFQQLENCNYALALGKEMGFTLIGIGGEDLASGNNLLTLGLLWQLMRAYTLSVLTQLSAAATGSNANGKRIDEKSIIDWARERLLREGKNSRLNSFQDPGISDARCVLDLIDCLRPGSVDYGIVLEGSIDTEKLQNAKLAISLAWRAGAKIYALPEDIVEVNPKMVMTMFACLMQLDLVTPGSGSRRVDG